MTRDAGADGGNAGHGEKQLRLGLAGHDLEHRGRGRRRLLERLGRAVRVVVDGAFDARERDHEDDSGGEAAA